jgi:glycosyltransferase involved in cell wall biosynthesis
MKALFISNDPSIFTQGSDARERMRQYAKALGELHIISRAPKGAKEVFEETLHLVPYTGGKVAALLEIPDRVRTLILSNDIEVVSAQDPFEHGWMALKAIRGTNAKLSIQIHTDFLSPWFTRSGNFRSIKIRMPFLNRIRVRIADRVIPKATGIRVVSKRISDSLITRYGTKIPTPEIIPLSVPLTPPSAAPLPEHPFSFAFITASRLEPEKRIEDILMALARLGPRMSQVGLFVVGEGRERRKLEALTKKLGLKDRVIFTGWRADDWGLMRSAHAYVQASGYEGYGVSLLKAALARIPIITTDVGIVGEAFKGYEDVLSVPPSDHLNLAVQMNTLLGEHPLRHTLVENAEHAAREHIAQGGDRIARFAAHLKSLTA